ncbi:unnamed protein product [Psylliodes chrysocephalus]|uniref:Uncharacterized protein n=1 Tax=Psylliodes chrysocephalus TaxID=3402493 RepID=A0A9P0D0U4_9CUCU|nr:unnamed protein product [Psylliodes chrysocephala]
MPKEAYNISYCDPCYPQFCCVPVTVCPNVEKRCPIRPVRVPVVPESACLTPLMIPWPCCQPCPAGYLQSPPPRPFLPCTNCVTVTQPCPPCATCDPCCIPFPTCGPCPPCSPCSPSPCPAPPCAI